MSDLIVIAFDHTEDARSALDRLRDQERRGRLQLEDSALVERQLDGTVRVKNEVSGTTETATVVGAALGGLVTFMFPIAGMTVGAAAGAAIGRALDTGVRGNFVAEVKERLRPGRSAVLLVVKHGSDTVIAAMRGMPGEVVQTTLNPEAEEALIAAVHH